jgi:hypothetical protein
MLAERGTTPYRAAPQQGAPLMTSEALETEFDTLMARAGLTIPLDRREGLLAGFADLRAMLPALRQPRTAAAEPSNVFRLTRLDA